MRNIHKLASSLIILGLIAALIVLPGTSETQAQDGGTISFGESVAGSVAAGIPSDFSFEANAGDVAEVTVLGFGFAPRVQILDGTRTQVLAENANTNAETTVEVSYTIEATGTHFIRVQGLTPSDAGNFGLSLNQGERELPPGTPIAVGETLEGSVDDPEIPAVYDFTTDPDGLVNISVRSLTGGYNPIVTLYSEEGDTIIAGGNPRLLGFSFLLASGEENLKLVVDLGTYEGTANFEVELAPAIGIEPIATEQPTDGGGGVDTTLGLTSPPSGCYVTTNQNVNIRSGGSTEHGIVGVFGADKYLSVTGYNDTNDRWYQVSLPDGGSGWVAGFVVTTGGPCDGLSEVSFPPLGQATSTSTPTVTLEGGVTATPSATLEGGVTATPTATYTATTEGVATAPPDGEINTQIDYRDGLQTFSGQISYPNGDTTDYINYTVIGFDSANPSGYVNISVSCSGPGAEFARINFQNRGSVGETTCPHSLSKFFTNESNLGWVRIDLVGGDNALVNWTVTLTGEGN
ncbi:MAG: SH3 domain-containing protein [Chloroflexi bacterium]|nr:SH3 domain-containing protein [Chloroflexota bacterium]